MNPKPKQRVCTECGAESWNENSKCWMCDGDNLKNSEIVEGEVVDMKPTFADGENIYQVLTLVSGVVALIVGCGLVILLPPLGIFYFFVATIALVATVVWMQLRRSHGKEVKWENRFLSMLITSGLSIVIATTLSIVLVVAVILILFVVCLVEMQKQGSL